MQREKYDVRVIETRERVARLEHRCSWCGEKINPGERFVRIRCVFEGEPFVNKFHQECNLASEADWKEHGESFEEFTMPRPTKCPRQT